MIDFKALKTVVVVCLLGMGCTTTPRVDVNAEAEQIRELDRQWVATFVEKDIEAAMRFFSEDAKLMPAMETPDGQLSDSGKYLIVWKKIAGEWKAIIDISNSDNPITQ